MAEAVIVARPRGALNDEPCALGGAWGGKIDDSIFPQKYLIDYVRVYQRQEAPVGK